MGTQANAVDTQYAIAMHGKPALADNYAHFPYANPNAPKGGRLNLGEVGTFDSLNPFIIKGVAPNGLRGLVYESLMARSADEPFTLYPLIAKSIEVPPSRAWITFHIDQRAQFSDGRPVTADDVIFSHDLLLRRGRPYLRSHYAKAAKVERLDTYTVRFTFKTKGDREIPLIIGLMPILPKHAVNGDTFDQTSLTSPIGSGPYMVGSIRPGSRITYQRNPDYWGIDHPSRRGLHNFDEVQVLYYRDATAVFEAFKTGTVDVRREKQPGRWLEGYEFPAMKQGKAVRKTFRTGRPAGMTGLVFNTRRKLFADPRVRRALSLTFDGPQINGALYHGRFVRSQSFFSRSGLAAYRQPANARERQLLAPFPDAVRSELMDGTWKLEAKAHRKALRKAFELLRDAGYRLQNQQLVHEKSGRPFSFEVLISSSAQERLVLTYAKTLQRLGIVVNVRKVEASQYWSRIGRFEFDMIQWHYSASLSPGNEQINRWASSHANIERSLNYAGVRNPAVDAMIEHMLTATERADFEAAVRAFDRALISGDYLIPLFHAPVQWYATWRHLQHPPQPPLLGTDFSLWWNSNSAQ